MNWTAYREPTHLLPERPQPMPRLPDPGVNTRGEVACNAPLIVGGETVGYCGIYVKVYADGTAKPHRRKRHRVEW